VITPQEKTDPRVTPRRFSAWRVWLFRRIESALVLLGGRGLYRRTWLRAGRFRMREEEVQVAGLPAELDGFTVAQLTDLHAGPFLGEGDLAEVVAAVNALEPEVIAITGDFVAHHWSEAELIRTDLAGLQAKHGVYAVFGNHDYKDRCEGRIEAAYQDAGVHFLRNASARLAVGNAHVAIVGVEDLEEARVIDLDAARTDLVEEDVEIVLCHNPMGARTIARPGCAAILSGHTHGWQLDLPWLRTLGPQHPGLRVEFGPTTLLVSRGLGVVGVPLRYKAPAEVVLLKLTRAEPAT
jgi:uncharacterized protein